MSTSGTKDSWIARHLDSKLLLRYLKIFSIINQDIWIRKIDCSYRDTLKSAAVAIQFFFCHFQFSQSNLIKISLT
jgi:hypothetical protein